MCGGLTTSEMRRARGGHAEGNAQQQRNKRAASPTCVCPRHTRRASCDGREATGDPTQGGGDHVVAARPDGLRRRRAQARRARHREGRPRRMLVAGALRVVGSGAGRRRGGRVQRHAPRLAHRVPACRGER
jgi:hypothetical protein